MAALVAAHDMDSRTKAPKMIAKRTWTNFFAVDSWKKEFTEQSFALFPTNILPRNSDEVPPDRNTARGL